MQFSIISTFYYIFNILNIGKMSHLFTAWSSH